MINFYIRTIILSSKIFLAANLTVLHILIKVNKTHILGIVKYYYF